MRRVKVRHFTNYCQAYQKSDLLDHARERACHLQNFVTFGHLHEINIVRGTSKWELRFNTDPNTSLNVKGEEEEALSHSPARGW